MFVGTTVGRCDRAPDRDEAPTERRQADHQGRNGGQESIAAGGTTRLPDRGGVFAAVGPRGKVHDPRC